MNEPLRLKAVDGEDVAILSACLQDAMVLVEDIVYLPEERRFMLVASRFQWERAVKQPASPDSGKHPYMRVKAGLGIENVEQVARLNIELKDKGRLLLLLAIELEGRTLTITFADDAAIRLEVSEILCHLQDFGDAWPTPRCPDHACNMPTEQGATQAARPV